MIRSLAIVCLLFTSSFTYVRGQFPPPPDDAPGPPWEEPSRPSTCPPDPSLIAPCTCSLNKTSKNGLPEISCINFNGNSDLIRLNEIFHDLADYLNNHGDSVRYERLLLVNSQLRAINETLFHGLQFHYLSIYETNLTEVGANSFQNMEDSVTYLLFKGDRLSTVFPALQPLTNLSILIFNLGLHSFQRIPRHALNNMPKLQRVTMNGVANSIEAFAFVNLPSLNLLKITNQLESIATDAFVIRGDDSSDSRQSGNNSSWNNGRQTDNQTTTSRPSNDNWNNNRRQTDGYETTTRGSFNNNNYGNSNNNRDNSNNNWNNRRQADQQTTTTQRPSFNNNNNQDNSNWNNGRQTDQPETTTRPSYNNNNRDNRNNYNRDNRNSYNRDNRNNRDNQTEEEEEDPIVQEVTLDLSNNKLDENSFEAGFIRLDSGMNITLDLSYNWIKYLPEDVFSSFFAINRANRLVLMNNKFECGDCNSHWIIRNSSSIRGRLEVNCYMNSQLTIWNYDWSHCLETEDPTSSGSVAYFRITSQLFIFTTLVIQLALLFVLQC